MCGTALPDIYTSINTRFVAQASDSILDVNIVSDHELVLVLDELRQRKHLCAPTVDGCAGVVCSLVNEPEIIWILWIGQSTDKNLVAG